MVRAPIVKRKALLKMTRILMGNQVPGSCQKGCPAVYPRNRLMLTTSKVAFLKRSDPGCAVPRKEI
ncbi:hypothetical protein Celaphus_00000735 [Cervus elaphus hippelaphus]|uniref:Uncharacterized protein n=1 Tax=Cervus elaphus hippelaphus TaxID=46360 RepID=A0A212D8S4_CEREH|nr:hypothetical protein Celaphus_00000735 [Cervus elaphus hippelaphus]